MAWRVIQNGTELTHHGYDARMWRWNVVDEESGAEKPIIVRVSGTALASAPADLPDVVAEARETDGRAAVRRFLDWIVPPDTIELDTFTEQPRAIGGIPRVPDAEDEVPELREISEWFRQRGIALHVERNGDDWLAPMLPLDRDVGSASYGTGPTPLEAARDARDRFLGSAIQATSAITSTE